MGFGGFLRQSTAVDVLVGPFVSSTDGDTEMTALTISQGDVLLSKNGQAMAQKNDNTALAHDADGYYNCELDATDTNTVGQLTLTVHEATSLAVRHDFQVVEEAVYDALYAASAVGPLLANSNGSGLTEAGGTGDHLTAINLPDQTMNITGNITGNLSGSVGSVTGAVGSVTGAVGSVTGSVGGNVTGSIGSLAAQAKLDVNAEVDTALADYDGPTNAEMEARTLAAASYATATALQTVDDEIATVDNVVDAIKVQTDKLTFTVANQIDSNVQSINDVTITGDGQVGTEFGV
jgi:hypothetical protein